MKDEEMSKVVRGQHMKVLEVEMILGAFVEGRGHWSQNSLRDTGA